MASEMYKLKPYYATSDILDVSDGMYKLNRIYGQSNKMAPDIGETIPPDVAALELRQQAILDRLDALKLEVEKLAQAETNPQTNTSSNRQAPQTDNLVCGRVLQDVVINASPENPPLYLLVLRELLSAHYKLLMSSFVHSSITEVPASIKSLFPNNGTIVSRAEYQLALTVIWKADKYGTSMMMSPHVQTLVYGDANIARYLARLIHPAYDSTDIVTATQIDTWLDQASLVISGSNKERAAVLRSLSARLGKATWVVGSQMSLADIMLWSALHQCKMTQSVPANVKKWLELCNQQAVFTKALQVAKQL